MKKILLIGSFLLIASLIAGCGTSGGGGDATTTTTTSTTTTTAATFSLTSTAFTAGGSIPNANAKNGEYSPDIPNATNASVPLAWSNPPSGTNYYALKMVDTNNGYAHWLVVNIPSSTTSLAEGASPLSVGTEVANDFTTGVYEGPWPPEGESHTYQFTIYALSSSLSAGTITNLATFNSAVATNLGTATLSGTFSW